LRRTGLGRVTSASNSDTLREIARISPSVQDAHS
jgi:hypothetical protein